jgi:hypothetical protein
MPTGHLPGYPSSSPCRRRRAARSPRVSPRWPDRSYRGLRPRGARPSPVGSVGSRSKRRSTMTGSRPVRRLTSARTAAAVAKPSRSGPRRVTPCSWSARRTPSVHDRRPRSCVVVVRHWYAKAPPRSRLAARRSCTRVDTRLTTSRTYVPGLRVVEQRKSGARCGSRESGGACHRLDRSWAWRRAEHDDAL